MRARPNNPIGDVLDWTYSGNKLHPTQKPLSVLLPLVETFPCGLRRRRTLFARAIEPGIIRVREDVVASHNAIQNEAGVL